MCLYKFNLVRNLREPTVTSAAMPSAGLRD